MNQKMCTKCKETKPLNEFYYHRGRKKHMSSCKSCNSKKCLQYQQKSGYRNTEKYVFYQRSYEVKTRAGRKNIPVMDDLQQHLTDLWGKSKKCAYTGIEMSINGYHHNPYAMTVDRKDPKLGYVDGNIVLCCSMANRMKQNLNESELVDWCNKILNHLSGRRET